MTLHTRDPDFVAAVKEVFQEAADKMLSSESIVLQIEQLWIKAIWKERERMFEYLGREDVSRAFEDKQPMIGQLRWIFANGTYLDEEPDLSVVPPFVDADASEYSIDAVAKNRWEVKMKTGQCMGSIEKVDGAYWITAQGFDGTERRLDESFSSYERALEFFEVALRTISQGMSSSVQTRKANDAPDTWYLEDVMGRVRVGLIRINFNLHKLPVKEYEAIFMGAPSKQAIFPTFVAAEQWLRMTFSEVQKTPNQSKKVI